MFKRYTSAERPKRAILIADGRFYKIVQAIAHNPNPIGTFVRGVSEFEPKHIQRWEFVTENQEVIEVNGKVTPITRRTGRHVFVVN